MFYIKNTTGNVILKYFKFPEKKQSIRQAMLD